MAEFHHTDHIERDWPGATGGGDDSTVPARLHAPEAGPGTPGPGPQSVVYTAADMRGLVRLAEVGTDDPIEVHDPLLEDSRHPSLGNAPNYSPDAGRYTPTSSVFLNTYHPFWPRAMGPSQGSPGPVTISYSEMLGPEGGTAHRVQEITPTAARRRRRTFRQILGGA